ncbi:MAG TPA: DUF1460 domain-containing protein [Armatimonadota bacterium]|nr:DUF1460 domain-containing protein [Armatimonadota bacterium]
MQTLHRYLVILLPCLLAGGAIAAGGGPRTNPAAFTAKQWEGLFTTVGAAPLGQRIAIWADLAAVDAVYAADPLGEGPGAVPDGDPLCDFGRVDCVTYVEQTLALALAKDQAGFAETLRRIRYKDGAVDFRARNHFFVSDWLPANAWCVRDVTAEVGGEAVKTMEKTIARKAFFAGKGVNTDLPDEQAATPYIPRDAVGAAVQRMKEGDIAIFVISTPGIIAGHVGLLRVKNGVLQLQHAGSAEGRVVTAPLERYVRGLPPRFVGMKVARPGEPAPVQEGAPRGGP